MTQRDNTIQLQGGIMKLKITVYAAVSLFTIFLSIGSGDCREVKKYSIEQFMKTVSIGGSFFFIR